MCSADAYEKSIDRIANSERVSYRINSLESNEQLESKCSRASYRIDSLEDWKWTSFKSGAISYRIDNLFSRLQTFCF